MLTNNQIYKQSEPKKNMARVIGIFIASLIIVLFTMTCVSAASSISISRLTYTYKVGSQIDIRNPCYYNGANCPPTTTCDLTVYDPENNVIINNQPMTYGGSFFNYTLPDANYSIGSYKSDMVCSYSGISGSQRFYLDIGTGGNQSLFIILSIASLLLLLVAVLLKNNYVGFISATLFIVTGLYVLIYGVGDFLGGSLYTNAIGWISLGLGLLFLIASAYSAISEGGLFGDGDEGYGDSLDSDTWGAP